MRKITIYFISLIALIFNCTVFADTQCDAVSLYENPRNVLHCYMTKEDDVLQPHEFVNEDTSDPNLKIKTYSLISQSWPLTAPFSDHNAWVHTLKIYIPNQVTTSQALLYVNGGTRYPLPDSYNSSPQQMDFKRIALVTHSVVAELEDVPPQYLTFDDGIARREDGIVAYSWAKFLDDPLANTYWPLQLPMTKAVIHAMDLVQKVTSNDNITVEHFAISGASKRGWVTWLAVLADDKQRINAIIPIVIDIFNIRKNIKHIHNVYQDNPNSINGWPYAFYDYLNENLELRMNSQKTQFKQLAQIIDPIEYLACGHDCCVYQKRLCILKYIISASGDDFFVPDSLELYFPQLPGEKQLRVFPNQSHYIDMKKVEPALLAFYQTVIGTMSRPDISWKNSKTGLKITTTAVPDKILLWEAVNATQRDFRLHIPPTNPVDNVTYASTPIEGFCHSTICRYSVAIAKPDKGAWKSYFVEVTFKQLDGEDFVVTTPAYVIGG